ncbi:MAG: type II toxin-antitoxin system PemK/MazF family toxin [Ardenticatenaceae bacterium]|nr:type II toxin-antitoxin system PemK/MazF family toxin [Anaerolineales bacterium]MCB8920522.1 type II toxin-antitoxin system PemK/MazF family toxin [Ardenticatenaceae bacterium]MCB8989465.1 type II toxin-antitoxin system PemK/MazF family toxin [Ardenticatenaceae bacterium]MCB9004997.1 type II toxin-antitoxin system PemK/MazF family toxin [Ardenticatenaceae bacterium]
MTPGDIVLIRFPQTDLQAGKLRPALVVAIAPGRHTDLLLALITSRTYQAIPKFDEIITPTDSDYATTGLKTRSFIRLARLTSVDPSIINARLGHISPERLRQIRKRLADWLKK